ncbi:serine/threonine/tyrosine protein kinase [Saccharomycopsis crataegensis]|uniref:Serine/threonine-protein kinase RAD53 n=1 Tax=Saccharomycopsis crataegensis TaxID=43959 RepID=A0AAV5QP56_9ASCO|nr:serine/threonine/tyrosine protein kinase [Saccharomycopsis crataegensis]
MNFEPTQQTQPTQPNNFNNNNHNGPELDPLDGVIVRLICTTGSLPINDLKKDEKKTSWIFGRNSSVDKPFGVRTQRLSGKHFRIWYKENNIMIQDLSTNGTWINNVRLKKGKNYLLNQGDEVAVGIGVENDVLKFIVVFPKTSEFTNTGNINEIEEEDVNNINRSYIIKQEVVGQGAFATVKKAIERSTGETYAVKIISKRKLGIDNRNGVIRELDILKRLDHPNIIKLKGFYEDQDFFYLVMEFISGGDLMDFVAAQGSISEEVSKEIIRQILEAINYVHSQNISHRDLKPDNILIANDNPTTVKVTDFGLAKIGTNGDNNPANQGSFLKTFCGTLAYVAPEVIIGKLSSKSKHNRKSYSSLVDMWSLGCLCYVILTGHLPFSGKTQDSLFKRIKSGSYHDAPLNDHNLSSEVRDFIDCLLQTNPAKRLSAEEALRHPWIAAANNNDNNNDSADAAVSLSANDVTNSAAEVEIQLDSPFQSKDDPQNIKISKSEAMNKFNGPDSDMIMVENESINSSISKAPDGNIPAGTLLTLKPLKHSIKHPVVFVPQINKPYFIGRNDTCNLSIDDTRMSKFHCIIMKKRHPIGKSFMESPAQGLDDIWLIDYSTNACHINGKEIGKGKKTLLRNEDQILLFMDKKQRDFLGFKVYINDLTGLFVDNLKNVAVVNEGPGKSHKPKFNKTVIEAQDEYDLKLLPAISVSARQQRRTIGNKNSTTTNNKKRSITAESSQPKKRASLNPSQPPADGLAFQSFIKQ